MCSVESPNADIRAPDSSQRGIEDSSGRHGGAPSAPGAGVGGDTFPGGRGGFSGRDEGHLSAPAASRRRFIRPRTRGVFGCGAGGSPTVHVVASTRYCLRLTYWSNNTYHTDNNGSSYSVLPSIKYLCELRIDRPIIPGYMHPPSIIRVDNPVLCIEFTHTNEIQGVLVNYARFQRVFCMMCIVECGLWSTNNGPYQVFFSSCILAPIRTET